MPRLGFALNVGLLIALIAAIWLWGPPDRALQLVLMGSVAVAAGLGFVADFVVRWGCLRHESLGE